MRFAVVLPFVGLATAFVLPDPEIFSELGFEDGRPAKHTGVSPGDRYEFLRSGIETSFHEELEDYDDENGATGRPHHGHGHGPFNLTIYELISRSNHTKKFVELVDDYDSIVQLLNSTKANYTLFVPTDEAFEKLPGWGGKPSKEFIEGLLKYHIGLGRFAGHQLLAARTIPTALDEKFLGGQPQRLRIRAGLFGARVNFYSRVVAGNVGASNGVVHAVNKLLAPPFMVGRKLSLFPAQFSTLLLAYEKTNFVDFIHHVRMIGSTVFAPDNAAFQRLGPRANAFLFNTEEGLGYLRALLKYQIVANTTLYSDALYREGDGKEVDTEGRYHLDLQTLLGDAAVSVDVVRFAGFVRIVVNKNVRVSVQDAIAKNGVIQAVSKVPIPPHKHHKGAWEQEDGEIGVEELKARLEGYLEENESTEEPMEDL